VHAFTFDGSRTFDFSATAATSVVDKFIDFYELLHVQPSAPAPVIKASYRAMMQKLNHHPDRGGDVEFAQLLNEAEKTLCNPATRLQYDILHQQYLKEKSGPKSDQASSDKKAGTDWSAPGGTPSGTHHEHKQQDQPTEQKSDTHDRRLADSLPAPTGTHCPFCLTVFSNPGPSMSGSRGYAATAMTPDTIGYRHSNRCLICNGARTPIEQAPKANDEQMRRMHRQLHNSDARVWTKWPLETPALQKLVDFSPTGCALVHSESMKTGQIVMIDTDLFNAICKVRHCGLDGSHTYRTGFEFLTLDMHAAPGALLNASA